MSWLVELDLTEDELKLMVITILQVITLSQPEFFYRQDYLK